MVIQNDSSDTNDYSAIDFDFINASIVTKDSEICAQQSATLRWWIKRADLHTYVYT